MYTLLPNDNYTTRTFNGILRKTNRPGFLTGTFLFIVLSFSCAQRSPTPLSNWSMQRVALQTRWATDVTPDNPLPEYPRPQMVRTQWQSLNGLWQYTITDLQAGMPTQYEGHILVPYPIESALSGVKQFLLSRQRLWYKRTFKVAHSGQRVLLHFGAVDWKAVVYVNGKMMGAHLGGYQQFSYDITASLHAGENELVVSVFDPSDMGPMNPYGKQSLYPHRILYTACSGIWQTVWLETVPPVYIKDLRITTDMSHLSLQVNADSNTVVEALAMMGDSVVQKAQGRANEVLSMPIPDAHLWSPDDPYLYTLRIRLLRKGVVVDAVSSYFGMRKIEIRKDDKGINRIFLNNNYTFNLGVLDQGYWPEGVYTAPTDAALLSDIQTIKAMGFNTIRKHVKVEPARWYYHCDRLGMLVWQDMIPPADYNIYASTEFESESGEIMDQLHNYPSIIMWVLFNEGWNSYDQERLASWMRSKDSSRIINAHSGQNLDEEASIFNLWAGSDVVDIHKYPGPAIWPARPGKAQVLGEWGGIRVRIPGHQWKAAGWGYEEIAPELFEERYAYLIRHLKLYEREGLSGAIFTQPYDVEIEENGLMTYDRKVMKIPVKEIKALNSTVFK